MREVEITFRTGIPLKIEGIYTPEERGYSYDSNFSGLPVSYSSFDVEAVYATDSVVDLYDLLSMADITEIEEEAIRQIEER